MTHSPTLDVLLDRLADAALAALPLPGQLGVVAELASIAFESAARMVREGRDPVEEFARIHGADPMLRTLARVAEERFPQSDPAPEAPDTLPFSEPPDGLALDEEDSRP